MEYAIHTNVYILDEALFSKLPGNSKNQPNWIGNPYSQYLNNFRKIKIKFQLITLKPIWRNYHL